MSRKSRHNSKQNLNYMSNRYTKDNFNNQFEKYVNIDNKRRKYHPIRKAIRWGIYILHKLDDYMQVRFYKWYY